MQQAKIVATVGKLGKVHPEATACGEGVVGIDLSDTHATDEDLRWLADLPTLRILDLFNTKTTGASLAYLRGLHRSSVPINKSRSPTITALELSLSSLYGLDPEKSEQSLKFAPPGADGINNLSRYPIARPHLDLSCPVLLGD